MRSIIFSAAILALPVWSFKDSSPFLVWSSQKDDALSGAQSELTSGVIAAEDIYGTISSLGCDWETLVVGHSEGLHNSRIGQLRLPSSSADLHIPYLIRPNQQSLDDAVDEWAQICGAQIQTDIEKIEDGKNVLKVDIEDKKDVASIIDTVPSPYILIVTGSHSRSKRQEEQPLPPSEPSDSPSRPSSTSPNNATVSGPLLERVQLLTVPIITSLLIVFFLLLPILYVGISALVGIQVPPRMLEIGKSTNVGKERKDQ